LNKGLEQRLGNKGSEQEANNVNNEKNALVIAICIGAGSVSLAKESGPPTIDIQKMCEETSNALGAPYGSDVKASIAACLADEKMAREQLVKNWAAYPSLARQRCVQPGEYLPSYVEWLACLDTTRNALKSRKERSASKTFEPSTSGQASHATSNGKGRSSPRRARP
jgi:hypothetical protein